MSDHLMDLAAKGSPAYQELRQDYNKLRAAINAHMTANGYPHTTNASEADRKLWSVLDRA